MKQMGFVDYRLENFHANVYLKSYRNDLASRGWNVAGCWAMDDADGRAWAKKNEVPYFDSTAALNDRVDAFVVLAPANPELHLQLCQQVFPFGKTTYVDKTFAPDFATAKQIFELSDKHETAIQTTSALRYTNVQAHVNQIGGPSAVQHMVAWGGGTSFDEYAIHPVELLISCMRAEAQSLMRRGTSDYSQLLINFAGNRTGVINVYTKGETPFAASLTTDKETSVLTVDASKIFVDMAAAMLDLFESGKPNIDRAESLMIRKILDAANKPAAAKGFVPL